MTTEQFTKKKLKERAQKVEEQAPRDYREAGFGEDFALLVESRADASKMKKEMEAVEKDLGGKILALLAEKGMDKVVVDQFRVTAYASQSRTISGEKLQEKLFELGVPAKKIAAALEFATQVKPYVALKVTDSSEPRKPRS